MFLDRAEAGRILAKKLRQSHITADLIVGLVHGGVVLSNEISNILDIPHTALLVKKIGSPGNPELAEGAVVPKGQSIAVGGKTVIITDDGAATGSTMKAAVAWVKERHPKNVIVAVPVAPPDVVNALKQNAEVIVLETPDTFGAVGEFYRDFRQLTDADVIKLLV